MIIDMTKITLMCLDIDKDDALEKLRDLGVMHIEETVKNTSVKREELEKDLLNTEKALSTISEYNSELSDEEDERCQNLTGSEVVNLITEATDDLSELKKHKDFLYQEQIKILPFSLFSYDTIEELKEKGVYTYLCKEKTGVDLSIPENATLEIISQTKEVIYFAIFSVGKVDGLPLAPLPENYSLNDINKEINRCISEIEKYKKKLGVMSKSIHNIKNFKEQLVEDIEFAKGQDNMQNEDKFAHIQGYIPKNTLQQVQDAAKENGWAIINETPTKDDKVPTYIKLPKIFDISKPIFEFIGIAPGYREWDISACFLIFFTIFFGMIVGDAGYGAIFLLVGLVMKFKFKNNKKANLITNLFLVLSFATVVWGSISGNYFGIPQEYLPEILRGISNPLSTSPTWIKGIEAYKDLPSNEIANKNVQYLCFLIAAIHLSFARLWKTILYINKIPKALGQLGWGFLIWGNFFLSVELIVFNKSLPDFVMYLYIIGFTLTVLDLVAMFIKTKDIGSVLNFPFGLIGSFVDVLSYIRLFAVGLSSYYIAKSFNDMGLMILPEKGFSVLIIATIFIILFGHILNIILALMGVLVHGIRLNTLEFSNHMELEWSGTVFKPFKKLINKDKQKEI